MLAVDLLLGILVLVGLVGSVLPFLPGTALIFAGAAIHALATGFDPIGPWRLLFLGVLTALAYGLDYVAGSFGVKKLGGSGWAMAGAVAGAVVGAFFGPLGLLVGPIVGAMLAELGRSRRIGKSFRSGLGTVLGMALGLVVKLSLSVVMAGLILWWLWRS